MDKQFFDDPDLQFVHWLFSNVSMGLPGYSPMQQLNLSNGPDWDRAFNPDQLAPTKMRRTQHNKAH